MRIAIWWEQESWGGVDQHLLTLLRNWPGTDDSFVVFHNAANEGMKRIASELSKIESVSTVSFPERSRFFGKRASKAARYFSLPLRFVRMKGRAKRILSRERFDALLADNGGYPGAWGALAALWASASLGIPRRVLLVHHAAFARGPLRQTFESLLDLGVQHWATDLVAVSRATRNTLIERRGFYPHLNAIHVIHNGVDASGVAAGESPDLRARLGISPGKFLVGMVGRLERYKGQEDLILALGELTSDESEKVCAIFIGGRERKEEDRLRRIAEKTGVGGAVRFAGYVDGDMQGVIGQLDLFAMLTKDFEGFGLTIVEAMLAGTPVLATTVGAVTEFVSPEVAVLVPPEAPADVATAIRGVMKDPAAAKERARAAREHIRRYDGKNMARQFHRLLLISGDCE